MAQSRIGIMGGSFNPIHCRHLQIAQSALSEMRLDRVIFIPNGNPPHKHRDLAEAGHRFEMTRLAVIPYEKFTVSDIEITRSGVIYTVDTLNLLHAADPDAEFVYLIGEDTLFELEHWVKPDEVFRLCSFAVCMRSHQSADDHPAVRTLRERGAVLHFLSLAPFDISASDIRRQVAQGVLNEALLPPAVCEYIRVMGLYGCPQSPAGGAQAYPMLKKDLRDQRLLHALAVAHTANRLARIHGLDADACELAGLLHDCAKCMDLKALQKIARDAQLNLTETEMASNSLLHAPVSAVVAKEKYGVRRQDILTAIAMHTVGYAGMSPMDMVIFLADKIEPYRHDIPSLNAIRAQADQNLYQATYLMLNASKAHVARTGRPLHPDTEKTIQWVRSHIQ